MKSAYDLAMERLAKTDPQAGAPLTPEIKERLAELDTVYKGRLAEREIFLQQRMEEARLARNYDDYKKVEAELVNERRRIEEEREEAKEAVRRSGSRGRR